MSFTQQYVHNLLHRRDRWAAFVLPEVNWQDAASRYKRFRDAAYVDLKNQRHVSFGPLDQLGHHQGPVRLDQVATLLHWTLGVAGYKLTPNWEDVSQKAMNVSLLQRRHRFTLPSGGGMYPHEIYLVANQIEGLDPGIYHYQNSTHRLARIRHGDVSQNLAEATFGACGSKAFSLVIAMNYWKNYYKYRAFTYHVVGSDTGVVSASIFQISRQLGLQPRMITQFHDSKLGRLLCMKEQAEAPFGVIDFNEHDYASEKRTLTTSSTGEKACEQVSRWVFFNPFIHGLELESSEAQPRSVRPPPAPVFPTDWALSHHLPEPDACKARTLDTILRGRESGFGRLNLLKPLNLKDLSTVLSKTCEAFSYDLNQEGLQHCFPVIYTRRVAGVEPAVFAYKANENTLYKINSKLSETALQKAYNLMNVNLMQAQILVFIVGDYQSMLECYGSRGYRMMNFELGYMVQRHYLAVGTRDGMCTHALFGLEPNEARQLLGLGDTTYFPLVTLTTGTPLKPCHFQYALL